MSRERMGEKRRAEVVSGQLSVGSRLKMGISEGRRHTRSIGRRWWNKK
jgi:hypothetical protein